jgi:hypothetical protein
MSLLAALAWVAPWSTGAEPVFDERCNQWDRAATAAVAELLTDHDPVVERRLNDAVFRLLRGRKNCRIGLPNLARQDFDALIDGRFRPYNRNR